jgi:hypothetical protein
MADFGCRTGLGGWKIDATSISSRMGLIAKT